MNAPHAESGLDLPARSLASRWSIDDFLTRNRLQLGNVLVDDRLQAGSAFGPRALPTTLFFEGRGRLVGTRVGELSEGVLAQRLAAVETVMRRRDAILVDVSAAIPPST